MGYLSEITMTVQERFAADHSVDIDRVGVIVRMARECGNLNEHYSNGDPHPKNRNAELWGNAVDVASAELLRYVERFGFTDVVYTGLGPTLMKGKTFVEIPY